MTRRDLVVLFCNERYGRAFEEAFRRWGTRRRDPRLRVVRSLKGMVPAGTRGGAARLGVSLRNRLGAGRPGGIVRVEDVNEPRFGDAYLSTEGRVFGVVAGFNQIFRPSTIARFDRLLNFHPSLLPFYRGPVPSYWCIRNGERATGITLHEVSPEIDAGAVVWQEALDIDTADPDELDRALARLGAAILPDVLDGLLEGRRVEPRVLPADRIYRTHVGYASFPGREGAR